MRRSLISGTTYTYDCPKSAVAQVIFRWRPYEFMEMKNVSLRPTTVPTDVQISQASSPTTAPEAK
jgi:hypothetical protein